MHTWRTVTGSGLFLSATTAWSTLQTFAIIGLVTIGLGLTY